MEYRTDIDGLRAYAVLSVFFFHLGYLPNGYLGVDIFFLISGYLITSIIFSKSIKNEFSILDFYQRRVRRIFPLLLFTTSLALIIGILVMLPDDLDSLAQSVFASNFSANNILMNITSSDYWSIKNEYKPLMHTWSLGVEEQFYLFYPFLFLYFQGKKSKYIFPSLILLTLLSVYNFLTVENTAEKFYLLHNRFFEFSIGGLGAIYFKNISIRPSFISKNLIFIAILSLIVVIISSNTGFNDLKIFIITFSTITLLVLGKSHQIELLIYNFIFKNSIAVFLGKISFSIYMMHQLILSFSRYIFLEKNTLLDSSILILFTIALSFFTYRYIENPFRKHYKLTFKQVLIYLIPIFIISSFLGLYIYSIGGIVKDYPALDIKKDQVNFERKLFKVSTNIHIQYNENIRKLDRPFDPSNNVKILVFGNSYARDVANILLESEFDDNIQVRYFDIARTFEDESIKNRILEADKLIFAAYGSWGKEWVDDIENKYNFKIDANKIWAFGIKDFGVHNGIHHNRIKNIKNFSTYRTKIKSGILERNRILKNEWGDRYIDLLGPLTDYEGSVLVFTPDGKFLSPDTVHLTKAGAEYFAELLNQKIKIIINS